MKLATETVSKQKIEIEVDSHGQFSAEFNDMSFSAKTRLELLEQLKKAVRTFEKTKPVLVTVLGLVRKANRRSWDTEHFIQGAGTVDAKLRGHHDRNRVWLLTSEDGQKFQVGGYRSDATIARRLTTAEAVRYGELVEAIRVATTALEDFVGCVGIDPAKALEAASRKVED